MLSNCDGSRSGGPDVVAEDEDDVSVEEQDEEEDDAGDECCRWGCRCCDTVIRFTSPLSSLTVRIKHTTQRK